MFQIYTGNTLVYEPGDQNLYLLSPKLTLEMGKAGSLEFTVPAGHPYVNTLKQLTKPVSVSLDGTTIFRGRILSGSRTFYNQRETYCEGVLSYLVDSVQKAVKYSGKTHALFRQIIANHNARMPAEKQFTVGNITVENRDISLIGQSDDISKYDYSQIAINSVVDNWNTTYDYIETCLISYCGGYLVTRQVGNINYIDWVADYTSTATQEIVFGENLLDLTDESSAEDIFTVLIPIGDDNLTVKTVNQNSDEIVDAAGVAKYGRIIRTNVFNNVNNPTTLLENGRRYLANNGDVPTTLTITAIDLHNVYPEVTAIHLGDRVYIRSDPHELSQYLTCTKIEYDLERPDNTVYTFGREKQSLTQRYREDQRKTNDTYGNDASGGYGVGASAGEEAGGWHWLDDNLTEKIDDAEADAKEDAAQKLKDFYDAYINLSPDQGKIDLGAIYRKVANDEYVLENNVGINLNAPQGTIDIFVDHSNLQSTTATANSADNKTARILLWAGEDGQGNIGSRIALQADLVQVSNRLEAVEGIFSSITTERAFASKGISAPGFYGSHYYVATSSDTETDLASHAHNIIANTDGGLLLTGPIPLSSRIPFNIADTQFYQAGVSARTASAIEYGKYSDDGTTDYGHVYVTSADGKKVYLTLPSNGYNAGYSSGYAAATNSISSVSFAKYTEDGSTDFGHIYVDFSDGTRKYLAISPNGYNQGYSAGYTAGRNSVSQRTVSSVAYAVNGGVTDYSHITVRFSDGNYQSNVSIQNAWNIGYNSGYEAGKKAGTTTGITKIYITSIDSGGNRVGVRAYHDGGGYEFMWLSPGDYWDGE